jgi:hypothetical protein
MSAKKGLSIEKLHPAEKQTVATMLEKKRAGSNGGRTIMGERHIS